MTASRVGHREIVTFAAALLAALASVAVAGDRSDALARDAIFGNETFSTNRDAIYERVARLDVRERYAALVAYVLPSESHASIRFAAEFAPAPHQRETSRPIDRLKSPVLDLIDAAQQAGTLDDLRDRIAALQYTDEVPQRQRLALLALAETARGDFAAAIPLLDELDFRLRQATFPELAHRWPETLLLTVAVEHPPLLDTAEGLLRRIVMTQVQPGHHSGPIAWDVHVRAVLGRLRYMQARAAVVQSGQEPPPFGMPPRLTQWHPVNDGDEATYAQGFANPHWHRFADRVEKLAGHRDDSLYFCSPLRGDFQVECDITGFGWREGQLAVGGDWLWLHYSHKQFDRGGLRGVTGTIPIEPRLSEVNDWLHYRSVVRNGVCRSYINGRLLLTQKLRETQFPWLAIRSPYWSATSVRDVHITGTPTIPDRIPLSNDPELSGWVRYHLDSVGGPMNDWRFDASLGPEGGIFARQKSEYSSMFQESLLRYHRPMLEDGVIEYEFEYQPGQTNVAPALDQQAFLIEPDGVRRHWITEGVWDNSGLDPLNRSEPLSSGPCPLQTGWNRLRLTLTGNVLSITLNDQPVLQTQIDEHDQRMFGLFHYADQSRVRIRNMVWSGDWPKTLPEPFEQELRDRTIDRIDEQLAGLKDRIEIDFAAQRLRSKLQNDAPGGIVFPYGSVFAIRPSSDGGGGSSQQPDGLLMTRIATQSFRDTQTPTRYRAVGDFDVIAEFSDLKVSTPGDGNSAIYLLIATDDPLHTHYRVWHGVYAHPGIDRRRVTQVEFDRYRPSGVEITYEGLAAEACDSGRLRIVRIGRRMHFMIAEEDSPTFRLLHSADVTDAPLKPDGIRIASGTYDNQDSPSGGVQVVWKKLTLRADRLTLPLFQD